MILGNNALVNLIPNKYAFWATGNITDNDDFQQYANTDRVFTDNIVSLRFPKVM